MADVKWIKISTSIFNDDAFELMDTLPEKDAIELIWFKLLVLAGKQNNNGLFLFKDTIPYTDEMLAGIFHRPLNIVRLAMKTFEDLKMIQVIDDVYAIPNWDKYQSLDSYEKKKERDKEYQQKRREKLKQTIEEKKSSDNRLTTERFCSYSISSSISDSLSINSKEIIEYLNLVLGSKYKHTSTKTQGLIKARLNDGFTVDDFKTVIDKKYEEWKGTSMEQYLRPETLFGTKFEGYLNQKVVKQTSNNTVMDAIKNRVDIVDEWV